MRIWLTYMLFFLCSFSFSQENMIQAYSTSSGNNLLFIQSFYKDQLLANKTHVIPNFGSFYPVSERKYDLITAINDSSKQYYTITDILFKKHLFELSGEGYKINISPIMDFSGGRDLNDTIERNLFQNTRGIFVEGDLLKNFSFSTAILENQGRYAHYESDYYRAMGELYPGATQYQTQNAVIPGGGRTKDFKVDGFDYAYAIGYINYLVHPRLRISAGNNQQFIGDGHRSLLLSDNSYSAPYLRIDWQISEQFSFTYNRSRLMNLMRRSQTSTAEAYYEAKGYSVNYFTYMPTKKINISLFEGSVWNRGDSLTSKFAHPLIYNPIPVLSGIILKDKNEVSSLIGLNIGTCITLNHRLYSQIALHDFNTDRFAYQIGYRGYRFFGLNDLMVQAEFNSIPTNFYSNNNPRLNYVHYNLPLAHSKGQGFNEVLIRANYEYKRAYIVFAFVAYFTKDYAPDDLLPVYREPDRTSGTIMNTNVEVGYRFNRKMNLTFFGSFNYRSDDQNDNADAALVNFGLRTNILNHYKDF